MPDRSEAWLGRCEVLVESPSPPGGVVGAFVSSRSNTSMWILRSRCPLLLGLIERNRHNHSTAADADSKAIRMVGESGVRRATVCGCGTMEGWTRDTLREEGR